ncbi:MAG: hypothetical protein A4E65_00372 [Syntrophorhabdus sp. PtaU1.Bin153]|nr:MAG: hypothetical protein A4E65_00372 [Syntrophorhabdus sp. PtaU1.Bin153]
MNKSDLVRILCEKEKLTEKMATECQSALKIDPPQDKSFQ